jgi:hypothetical protein
VAVCELLTTTSRRLHHRIGEINHVYHELTTWQAAVNETSAKSTGGSPPQMCEANYLTSI